MGFVDARALDALIIIEYKRVKRRVSGTRHRFGSNLSSAERFKNISPLPRYHLVLCSVLAALQSMASLNDGGQFERQDRTGRVSKIRDR